MKCDWCGREYLDEGCTAYYDAYDNKFKVGTNWQYDTRHYCSPKCLYGATEIKLV